MLKMRNLLLISTLATLSFSTFAMTQAERDYHTIAKMKVIEVETDPLDFDVEKRVIFEQNYPNDPYGQYPAFQGGGGVVGGIGAATGSIGQVLAVGRELIALGESLYTLVDKGRPSNQTTYAPISVLPKINGVYADVFETEDWKAPKQKTYRVVYENLYGMDVVDFKYTVLFAYGGTYEGKGAYITSAQIIPASINTLWGYDFKATMKLGGMSNIGKTVDPVAQILLTVEYTVETILKASLTSDTFTLTGKGYLNKL